MAGLFFDEDDMRRTGLKGRDSLVSGPVSRLSSTEETDPSGGIFPVGEDCKVGESWKRVGDWRLGED